MPPNGIRIGGAYFEFEANNTQLLAAFVQNKAKANEAALAVKKAVDAQSAAIKSGSNVAVAAAAAQTRAAQTSVQAAVQSANRYRAMGAAAAQAAGQVNSASNQITSSNQRMAGGFLATTRSMVGFGATVVGIQAGAAGLHEGLVKLAGATARAEQAQFALNKTYGDGAKQYISLSKQIGDATGTATSAVQKGAQVFGTLEKNYGFTTEQIENLIKVSLDMAAVTGVDAVEAFKSVQAAMRGEGEAAEKLGFTLNRDAVKAMANMTDEQRKNFETLSDVERAQIIYNEALRQAAPYQNAATERTNTAYGRILALGAAVEDAAAAFGKLFVPALGEAAEVLTQLAKNAELFTSQVNNMPETPALIRDLLALAALGPFAAQSIVERRQREAVASARNRAGLSPEHEAGLRAAYPPNFTETPNRTAPAPPNTRARDIADREEAKRRAKRDLEESGDMAERQADQEIEAIEREKKAKIEWYDEEKDRLEARRHYMLEDIEERKEAALAALQEEKDARKRELDDAIDQAEAERDVRIQASEAAKDSILEDIRLRAQAYEKAREQEDRETEDQREKEDRDLEDSRRNQDQIRERAYERERTRRERAHEQLLRDLQQEQEAVERNAEKRLRAIERESEKASEASRKRMLNIERRDERESEAHRKRLQELDDEEDARLRQLDLQLKSLDAEEKRLDTQKRLADLNKDLADAQKELQDARGKGTPAQIEDVRNRLALALRRGDTAAAEKYRKDLEELAGKGVDAVKQAQDKIKEIEDRIREERLKGAKDSERKKLEDLQDKIRQEIEMRRRQLEEEERARQQQVEKQKEAEQEKLRDLLQKLERRKEGIQDATKEELENIQERRDKETQAFEESEEESRTEFERETERIEELRRTEDRALDDRRQKEDRDRKDRRLLEDQFLDDQRRAAEESHQLERDEVERHFNGPDGVITKYRRAQADLEIEFRKREEATRNSYEQMRKDAEHMFTNPEKTGLIDNLEKARATELKNLDDSKTQWENWAKDVKEYIEDVMKELDAFVRRAGEIKIPDAPGRGGNRDGGGGGGDGGGGGGDQDAGPPPGGSPGSGRWTKSSPNNTTSRKSGKKVKGDPVSWIQDAMEIMGVDENWLRGLHQLVRLESGGDPHNQNPNDVIDRNGRNLGKAKGLLQMLQSTYESNRHPDLPNDIWDPVSNAVSSIRYIIKRYGHVNHIPGLFEGPPKFEGYAGGGVINEPIIGLGMRSHTRYAFGERGPERVTPMASSLNYNSQLPMRMPDYHTQGLVATATSRTGGDIINWSISGIGMDDVIPAIRRRQNSRDLLRRVLNG
jgi:hypothetical protein